MAMVDDLWLLWRHGAGGLWGDRRTVGELLRARDDDAVARFEAFEHGVVVADDRTDLDGPLLRDERAGGLLGDEREKLAVDPQHSGDGHDEPVRGLPDDPRA